MGRHAGVAAAYAGWESPHGEAASSSDTAPHGVEVHVVEKKLLVPGVVIVVAVVSVTLGSIPGMVHV